MEQSPLVILLVEDDPGHAELTRRSLVQARVPTSLIHVKDGQEALDYLYRQGDYAGPSEHSRPHLILLDLRLPRVDGLEVLRQVKADAELGQIPVVILTTSYSRADVKQAYASHASSYLVKPVDFAKFTELMRNMTSYWLVWNRYAED
jgi:two-component system, response regulator